MLSGALTIAAIIGTGLLTGGSMFCAIAFAEHAISARHVQSALLSALFAVGCVAVPTVVLWASDGGRW